MLINRGIVQSIYRNIPVSAKKKPEILQHDILNVNTAFLRLEREIQLLQSMEKIFQNTLSEFSKSFSKSDGPKLKLWISTYLSLNRGTTWTDKLEQKAPQPGCSTSVAAAFVLVVCRGPW